MELAIEKPQSVIRLYDENTGTWRFIKADKESAKSMEIVEKTLRSLGLSKNEVRVYLYLARAGEKKASEISEVLSLHRTETYRILRDLEKKGLVSSVFEKPLKFIATPFEKALDVLIKAKKIRIRLLEKRKERLVGLWLSLPKFETEPERKEVFQVLEGEEQINLKAEEILSKVQREFLSFLSECDISSFYHSGFLDKLENASKKNIKIKLLTDYSPKSCFFLEKLKLKKTEYSVSPGVEKLPTFMLADGEQLLLLIRKDNGKKRVAALWTNYKAFIAAMKILFQNLWESSLFEKSKLHIKTNL